MKQQTLRPVKACEKTAGEIEFFVEAWPAPAGSAFFTSVSFPDPTDAVRLACQGFWRAS